MKNNEPGFSLVEVLLSMFVISAVILSYVQGMLNSLNQTHKAYDQSYAQVKLVELINCLQSSRGSLTSSRFHEWQQSLVSNLPNGKGNFSVSGSTYHVEVKWGRQEKLVADSVL